MGLRQTYLAPNGKPSNLTPEQWRLVRTPEFKRWFGDWENSPETSSKVVDENNEPLVVYHGTNKKFNIFQPTEYKRNFGTVKSNAFFFAKDRIVAEYIAELKSDKKSEQTILPVFLNIKNMLDFTDEDIVENVLPQVLGMLPDDDFYGDTDLGTLFFVVENKEYAEEIKKMGYGGVELIEGHLMEQIEHLEGEIIKSYAVFESEQIKLADGTNTTFDGENPDIRFDNGGLVAHEVGSRINNFIQWFDDNGWKALNPQEVINSGLGKVDDYFWLDGYTFESPDKNVLLQFSRNARLRLEHVRAKKIWVSNRQQEPIIILDSILVKEKGKGIGTKTINLITDLATKFGLAIHLEPKPILDEAYLDKQQLYEFYKKAGFYILYDRGYDKIMAFDPNNHFENRIQTDSLLAPNGEPTQLTPEQWRLVRAPEFKRWFGDWEDDPMNASKVLDKNGEPLVCHHGSPSKFTVFNENIKNGYFFTQSKYSAKNFGNKYRTREEPIVYDVFLNIRKLFDPNNMTNSERASLKEMIEYVDEPNDLFVNGKYLSFKKSSFYRNYSDSQFVLRTLDSDYRDSWLLIESEPFQRWLKKGRYDGYMVRENDFVLPNYAVYKNKNIKLADGTNVTFDGNKADIRFEKGGQTQVLLAPNGKPSNLTPEQYRLVRSPEFKRWFGDWELLQNTIIEDPAIDEVSLRRLQEGVSKVVDDNGEPLVLYRGMPKDRKLGNVFKYNVNFFGYTGIGGRLTNKFAFYFTNSRKVAEGYAKNFAYGSKSGDWVVKEYFLNIKTMFKAYTKVNEDRLSFRELYELASNGEKFIFDNPDYREIDKRWSVQPKRLEYVDLDKFLRKSNRQLRQSRWDLRDKQLPLPEDDAYVWSADSEKKYDVYKNFIDGKQTKTEIDNYGVNRNQEFWRIYLRDMLSYDGIVFYEETHSVESWERLPNGEVVYKFYDDFMAKTYGVFEPENIKLADGTNATFDAENPDIRYAKGGRTIAQTPSPIKDRVYGSQINPKKSSSNLSNAERIEFSDSTMKTIKKKIQAHNQQNPNKQITLESAKAVVRRGMGAYSKSHRPTISGGKPNSRVAWGLARLNAFMYKIVKGKSKSGKYKQDDDLINELGYKVSRFDKGGTAEIPSQFFGSQAGGVLIYCKSTERFLILLRSPYVLEPFTWGIISGKLDSGENIEETVRREAFEETGYDLPPLYPSYVFERTNFKFHNFLAVVSEEFEPDLNWENWDYAWVGLEQMPDNLHFGLVELINNGDIQNTLKKITARYKGTGK